jgi:hypothetical protein
MLLPLLLNLNMTGGGGGGGVSIAALARGSNVVMQSVVSK